MCRCNNCRWFSCCLICMFPFIYWLKFPHVLLISNESKVISNYFQVALWHLLFQTHLVTFPVLKSTSLSAHMGKMLKVHLTRNSFLICVLLKLVTNVIKQVSLNEIVFILVLLSFALYIRKKFCPFCVFLTHKKKVYLQNIYVHMSPYSNFLGSCRNFFKICT